MGVRCKLLCSWKSAVFESICDLGFCLFVGFSFFSGCCIMFVKCQERVSVLFLCCRAWWPHTLCVKCHCRSELSAWKSKRCHASLPSLAVQTPLWSVCIVLGTWEVYLGVCCFLPMWKSFLTHMKENVSLAGWHVKYFHIAIFWSTVTMINVSLCMTA